MSDYIKEGINYSRLIERKDWLYFGNEFIWIPVKEGGIVKFKAWEEQEQYFLDQSLRDCIVKPRQIGFTTIELIRGFCNTIFTEGYHFKIIMDKISNARNALDNLKVMYNKLKEYHPQLAPLVDRDNVNEFSFPKLNSKITVLTCGKSYEQADRVGRSGTCQHALFSEYAYYPYPEVTYKAFSDSVPITGIIVLESTPNGRNDFYIRVQLARDGKGIFKLHFNPWFKHSEYNFNTIMEGRNIGLDATYDNLKPFDKDEQELLEAYHLVLGQIAWRRWKIEDKGGGIKGANNFYREFPVDLESCFRMGEGGYFDQEALAVYNNLIKEPISGYEQGVYLFELPIPNERYIISEDSAGGGEKGHNCSASIWKRSNWEQVGHIFGKWNPIVFTNLTEKYGTLYNTAMIAPENVGVGIAVVSLHVEHKYPNLYWHYSSGEEQIGYPTNSKNARSLLFIDGNSALINRQPIIRSRVTLDQLYGIVWNDELQRPEALPGNSDDAVIDLLIAIQVLKVPEFQRQSWGIY